MIGVRDWPNIDTPGCERGIGAAGEGHDFMLVGVEDFGEDCGTKAAGSSGDCDFDHGGDSEYSSRVEGLYVRLEAIGLIYVPKVSEDGLFL